MIFEGQPGNYRAQQFLSLAVVVIVLGLASCRTVKEIPLESVRPISTEKLLRRVEQNAFEYKNLTIKRIQCNISNGKSNSSFQMNLKAKHDDRILILITKMNIPVGRVLLTRDSVTYVNYIERNYFVDDYSVFCKILNLSLNFDIIQSVIENNIFYFQYNSKSLAKNSYEAYVEEGRYVLQSDYNENLMKKEKRFNNIFCNDNIRYYSDNIISQKYYFNAQNYALEKFIVMHKDAGWHLETAFDNFIDVDKQNYPGSIEMKLVAPDDIIELKIRLSGFSTEKTDDLSLRIPAKYTRSRL
jgi:hypothetical protein